MKQAWTAILGASLLCGCGGDDVAATEGGGGAGTATHAHGPATTAASTGVGGSDACLELGEQLQQVLDQLPVATGAPGATMAVTTQACGTWTGATGTSTPTEPMRTDIVMGMGSITKTFVAAATIDAAEQGLLDLDASLAAFRPDFPGAAEITLRMLLNHTSDIPEFATSAGYQGAIADAAASGEIPTFTPDQLIQYAVDAEGGVTPTPGAFAYSNTDYILLGLILEEVTGQSIAPLLRSQFIGPVGLGKTAFGGAAGEPEVGELSHCYLLGQDFTGIADWSGAWAAGAMISDAEDLSKWAQALYGGDVLSADGLAQMLDGVPAVGDSSYGLGAILLPGIGAGRDVPAVGHNGEFPFYESWMLYFPASHASFGVMINAYPADGTLEDPVTVPERLDAAVLDQLADLIGEP